MLYYFVKIILNYDWTQSFFFFAIIQNPIDKSTFCRGNQFFYSLWMRCYKRVWMLINNIFTDGNSIGYEIEKILNTFDINGKVREIGCNVTHQFTLTWWRLSSTAIALVMAVIAPLCTYTESDNTKFNTPAPHSHLRPCNTNETHDTWESKWLIGPNLDIFTKGCTHFCGQRFRH